MPSLRFKDKVFYGWVVVSAGLVISLISFGIRYSFGVFFNTLEIEFELTRSATSGIFSAYMVLSSIFAILGGWALDKYGPTIVVFLMGLFTGISLMLSSQVSDSWQLFISFSLLLALGTGSVFNVVNSTVSRWFNRKRGFALGISSSGGPLGAVVMAPFATYLISNLDWRTAFIVLGFISWLIILSLSMLLKKYPSDIGLLPDGVEISLVKNELDNKNNAIQQAGESLLNALKTNKFWFLGFLWFSISLSVHLILTHIVPHAIDLGISPIDAAVIISVIGGAAIVGRIAIGRISDIIGRNKPAITCALVQFGTLIWLVWIQELKMFYTFAVVFGFSWGSLGSIITALIGDIFGMHNIGIIMGAILIGWNIGAAVGPFIGGVIFDVTNNYSLAFLTSALAMLLAALLAVWVRTERNV